MTVIIVTLYLGVFQLKTSLIVPRRRLCPGNGLWKLGWLRLKVKWKI
jgi:hypothetical protein